MVEPLGRRLLAFGVLQVPFLVFGHLFCYRALYSWFRFHDDEGYVMMSVSYLLRGARIYDDVPILYGPFLFFYKWILHGWLGVPLTHDAIRMHTLVVWMGTALLLGLLVLVAARSIAAAISAQFTALLCLGTLCNEPGHPQELVALLLVLSLTLSVGHGRLPHLTLFLLGTAAAAVLCLKLNLGILAIAALGTAALSEARVTGFMLALRPAAALLLMVLPWLLLKNHWTEPWAMRYAGLVSLSAIPVGLLLWKYRAGQARWTQWAALGAGLAATCGVSLVFILQSGSSWTAILDCLWLMPQRLVSYTTPAPIGVWSTATAAASAVVGLSWILLPPHRLADVGMLFLKAGFWGLVLVGALFFRPDILLNFATPWVWLALPSPRDDRLAATVFPRTLAVITSLMASLWAYPVPGSQLSLSTFLLLVPAGMALGDVLRAARSLFRGLLDLPAVKVAVLSALLLALAARAQNLQHRIGETYETSIPIRLAGASQLRLQPELATLLTTLAQELRSAPDTFLCTDGFYSMYFWTDKEPPTRMLIGHTIDVYSARQQESITAEVLSRPELLLLVSPSNPQFDKPFYQNLFRSFRPRSQIGPFVIMSRATGEP